VAADLDAWESKLNQYGIDHAESGEDHPHGAARRPSSTSRRKAGRSWKAAW
jgi:hypothetical protein